MVDLHWKSNILNSNVSPKSSKISLSDSPIPKLPPLPTLQQPIKNDISPASFKVCTAYENYLRLPHLRKLWASNDFPNWANEPVLKPAFHALEITFRFISTVLSDPRPYLNRREFTRRLESLATFQVQIIAMLCEDEEQNPEPRGTAPVIDVNSFGNSRSYSEASFLSRIASWHKSRDVAQRILFSVEREMSRCSYTLGLGEANLAGKPILRYDAVCKPNELHALETTLVEHVENYENVTLQSTHQILESWSRVSRVLLERVNDSIDCRNFGKASMDCYAVERIWKLLTEVEDLHLMIDPDDFLKLKKELGIRPCGETVPFCLRSKELVEMANMCKDLRKKVPMILEVEVDLKGGPGMVEAAMKVYVEKRSEFEKVHVLQAMQAIETAMKRFFYAYNQVVAVVMGSAEANGNRFDSLTQIFLEPTYFPSLDAAKTFLGYYWDNNNN
ncbi:hypothetical protein TanjilG_29492 [Lupinus angustifolius]|uniref:Hs1pro-1 C-terminal domain-containing protein n=1 Tax=Lupinus angustifolius TaxID=3871 RepID=A0A4P1R5H0_LUPAN|nr:PREDICTED: nematode resistance protein-like HSPRO2 [Lupinus angustifolius]OIW02716.1 hypothetical protein TanjilG_29492 [Lupinus angustifolius]